MKTRTKKRRQEVVNDGPRRLLSIREVAHQLHLSRAKTYDLILSGRLRSLKLDRCRRIAVEDLEVFLAGLKSER